MKFHFPITTHRTSRCERMVLGLIFQKTGNQRKHGFPTFLIPKRQKCPQFLKSLFISWGKCNSCNFGVILVTLTGRIKQLIDLGMLSTASIRLFVLDEADKLLEEGSFQEQIKYGEQVRTFCKQHLTKCGRQPTIFCLSPAGYSPVCLWTNRCWHSLPPTQNLLLNILPATWESPLLSGSTPWTWDSKVHAVWASCIFTPRFMLLFNPLFMFGPR